MGVLWVLWKSSRPEDHRDGRLEPCVQRLNKASLANTPSTVERGCRTRSSRRITCTPADPSSYEAHYVNGSPSHGGHPNSFARNLERGDSPSPTQGGDPRILRNVVTWS